MKKKTSIIEAVFLGSKYKKILTIVYASIILIAMSYFIGEAIGDTLYYATH
ncbi:hypothetical protein [Flavobacterium sp. N502536]|uniref:hypothetical protein n=1 Tax=Flavobacterium sp. N502536 TaxID=2986837 RepID=UPI002222566F|nr:hypothetical protein [Flavobacterium sp. N502536]